MGIEVAFPRQAGTIRTIVIHRSDLPRLVPVGARLQVLEMTPDRLRSGDVVATPDGKFRRFWSTDGGTCWVTDQSGLHHERCVVKNGLISKVMVQPGIWHNLIWRLGALAGSLRRAG